ncbi:prepilin-type N-terminal cleavage/methylation domain-containing protein [Desulfosporosinus acidiphilus SJ4]|uniref:Prepilin-type N-terminal cleavage/methylation domain-containing protein n=1 Tax=Desulfosporosinus acidiphilus (strain DSM 22704 / JCM 16185 / SJ4) TaxID=646529 RepID=I4D951_DESAJ|nr:type II secretion system protein [Desulfosporosinus acidiphilus]AFM42325.1 prepilin-type N-terminal cleavage/methylation domain-containing protein [Desulfosporosinus acidiphilus SJ4]
MMRHKGDEGMTLLEVVFAISILLIGVTFVVKSDSAMYHYRSHDELRQRMLFYAAGQMERVLENQSIIQGNDSGSPEYSGFQVVVSSSDYSGTELAPIQGQMKVITVTVSVVPPTTHSPDPITLTTCRVEQ